MYYAILILAFVGILYNLVLAIVQMRSASNPTPANVSDVFDAETYLKWKQYSRERSVLSIVFTCITGAITLAMLPRWVASRPSEVNFWKVTAVGASMG